MQKFLVPIYFLCALASYGADSVHNKAQINWLVNYEEALRQSKASSKPMLLFFTGSDWCHWCHKLEAEIINTPEFIATMLDKFIFVMLDFPQNKETTTNLMTQNKELQKKHSIRGLPTIVLVDSAGKRRGSAGYKKQCSPQDYADSLVKLVE